MDAIFKKGAMVFSGRVAKANLSARAFMRAGDRQDGNGGVGADSYDTANSSVPISTFMKTGSNINLSVGLL